jgi:tRNA(fMet)-specific endonuclease VapC
MYLLDTNVCVEIINGRPAKVRERFDSVVREKKEICVSSVTAFELWYGAEKSDRREITRGRVDIFLGGPVRLLSFDEEDARYAGEIRGVLELHGRMIGPFDTLIAGQALRHKLTVVTANTREFSRVNGLNLENWTR